MQNTLSKVLFILMVPLSISSCAYRMGYGQRSLPGGFDRLAVPVFKNRSEVVGIEGSFTNSLIRQFGASKVARVVSKNEAPVFIEGEIVSIELVHEGKLDANELNKKNENSFGLPDNTVLTSQYRVLTTVSLVLKNSADKKILWQGNVKGERVYPAPQVGLEIVNSVNPLYNHNARIDIIEQMSVDMMTEGHDRLTENF